MCFMSICLNYRAEDRLRRMRARVTLSSAQHRCHISKVSAFSGNVSKIINTDERILFQEKKFSIIVFSRLKFLINRDL